MSCWMTATTPACPELSKVRGHSDLFGVERGRCSSCNSCAGYCPVGVAEHQEGFLNDLTLNDCFLCGCAAGKHVDLAKARMLAAEEAAAEAAAKAEAEAAAAAGSVMSEEEKLVAVESLAARFAKWEEAHSWKVAPQVRCRETNERTRRLRIHVCD